MIWFIAFVIVALGITFYVVADYIFHSRIR